MTKAIIETPRVLLRSFAEGDLPSLVELCQDYDVMRYIAGGCSGQEKVDTLFKRKTFSNCIGLR